MASSGYPPTPIPALNRGHWLASSLRGLYVGDGISARCLTTNQSGAINTPSSFTASAAPLLGSSILSIKDTTGAFSFSGRAKPASANFTAFALVRLVTSPSANNFCILSDSDSTGAGWRFEIENTSLLPSITATAVANIASSGIAVSTGIPYLIGVTTNPNGTDFLTLNLNTGEVKTSSSATTATSGAPTGTSTFCNFTTGQSRSFGGYVRLAGYSYQPIGLAGLRALAANPWAIVMPQGPKFYVKNSTATFIAPSLKPILQAVNRAGTY